MDADLTRLAQVFANLLNNAVEIHRTRRCNPAPRREPRRRGDGRRSTDSGVGIPPDMLPRIFDMFTQLQEHRDRTHGGLGIGLTLARRLVELHAGTIEASSEGPGRGSRFTVRLPCAQTVGASIESAHHEAAPSAPCRYWWPMTTRMRPR